MSIYFQFDALYTQLYFIVKRAQKYQKTICTQVDTSPQQIHQNGRYTCTPLALHSRHFGKQLLALTLSTPGKSVP